MPRVGKNANRPAVNRTTWIARDTTMTATTLNCSARESGADRFDAAVRAQEPLVN
jgi:hypothetical protein